MAESSEYYNSLTQKRKDAIEAVKKKLPQHAHGYINECLLRYQVNTAYNYAHDIQLFYMYIKEKNPLCKNMDLKGIPIDYVESLGPQDINEFQTYVLAGHKPDKNGNVKSTGERSVARRMAAVRNYFKYLIRYDYLKIDPTLKAVPKKKETEKKDIRRLNSNQVGNLMNAVSSVKSASYHSKVMSEVTAKRDLAIMTLFLNTGIRVSECVGLDLTDVNFTEKQIKIVRKGGGIDYLFINKEIEKTLLDYIKNERPSLLDGEKNPALFISLKHRRLSVRSIQHMIEKYGKNTGLSEKLTPHKLRRTYGTALYNETGDIYMVADVLGHKDINTTSKHYADIEEKHKRQAANINLYGYKTDNTN